MTRKATVQVEAYGAGWYDEFAKDPVALELCLYASRKARNYAPESLSKWEHFRKAIKMIYPDDVFRWSYWTDWMGEAWCEEGPMTVWGAGGTTKSGTMGMFAYMDLLANPLETITVIITNPMVKHSDRCFGNVLRWRGRAPRQYQVGAERQIQPKGLLTVNAGDKRAGIVCTSTNPGESAKDIFGKVGTHAKRNRLIVDEPQGTSDSVLDLYLNFGASGEYKEGFIGNPSTKFDPLGRHSEPLFPTTWKQVTDDEPTKWQTKREIRGNHGTCIVLDGRQSPAKDYDPEDNPYRDILPETSHVESALRSRGLDDPWVWNQIIGRIPPGGQTTTMIDEAKLIELGMRDPGRWDSMPEEYAGADFAPESADLNILYRAQVGYMEGRKVAYVCEKYSAPAPIGTDKTTQLAQLFSDKLNWWEIPLNRFAGDATGEGSKIITRIEELSNASGAIRIQFGGGPTERKVLSYSPETGKDRYANRSTEIPMNLAVFIEQGQWLGVDLTTADELLSRGVETHPTKHLFMLEPKAAYRKRFDKSPDHLDAMSVLATMLKEQGVLVPGEGSEIKRATSDRRADMKRKVDNRIKLKNRINVVKNW